MAYIVTQQPAKGLCKKTVKALRWLGFLSFALVSLVMLAQYEQELKLQQTDYGMQMLSKSAPSLSIRH